MAPSRRVPQLNIAGIGSPREATLEKSEESLVPVRNPNFDAVSHGSPRSATGISHDGSHAPLSEQPAGVTVQHAANPVVLKSSHEWKLLSPRSLAALQFTNELDNIFSKNNLKSAPNSPRQGGAIAAAGRPHPGTILRSKSQIMGANAGGIPTLLVNQMYVGGLKDKESQSAAPSPRLSKPNFTQAPPRSPGGLFIEQIGGNQVQPARSGAAEISRFGAERWLSSNPGVDQAALLSEESAQAEPVMRNKDMVKRLQLDKGSGAPRKRSSNEGKLQRRQLERASGVWRLEDAAPSQESASLDGLVSNSLELVKKENSSGALTLATGVAEERRVKRGSMRTRAVKLPEQRIVEQTLLVERGKGSPRGNSFGGQLKLEIAPVETPVEAKPEPEFVVTWTGDPPLLPQPNHGRAATHVPQPLSLLTARQVSVLNLPADISKMSPKHSPGGSSPRTPPVSSDPPPVPEKHFPMAAPQLGSLTQRLYEKDDVRLLPGFGANHWVVYDRETQTDPTPFPTWKPPRHEPPQIAERSPRGPTPGFENAASSPTGAKPNSALQMGFENLKIGADLKGILGGLASDVAPLRPASHNALPRVVKETAVGSDSSATSSGKNTPRAAGVLSFESRFEGGNLRKATLVDENEYDLMLQTDVGMSGHTQWFYFGVRNMRPKTRYKFNVLNLLKPKSLFQEGMRILAYSERLATTIKQGWFRTGDEIAYFPNKVKKKGTGYYTLTFVLDPPFADDTLYLAYCYPYTYSDLQAYLKALCADPILSPFVERELLCRTLSGNRCDLLTITSRGGQEKGKPKKRAVVLSARVHPGESNASWMMKGALDFLTSARPEAEKLRETTVFKIVPMLNPDGVINGNHRCSLAQVDLNRVYTSPLQERHPTVWHIKEMVKRLQQEREVIAYVDLHGHSAKKNIFMYGCENKHAPAAAPDAPPAPPSYAAAAATRLAERVFPYLVSKAAPDAFSFADCNFRVQKSKESTARVVGWREFGLLNCLTLEASFAGPSIGRVANHHFTMADLMDMGASLCRALLDYCTVAEASSPERSLPDILKEVEAVQPGTSQGDPGGSDEDSEAGSSASDDVPHDVRQGKGGLAWALGGRKSAKTPGVPASDGVHAAATARVPGKRKKRRKKKVDLEEMARKMGTAKVHSEMAASVSAMLQAKGGRVGETPHKPGRSSEWVRPWPDVARLLGGEGLGGLEKGPSFRRLPVEAPIVDLGVEGSVIKRAPRRTSNGNIPLPRLEKGTSFKLSPAREPPADLDLSWLPPL